MTQLRRMGFPCELMDIRCATIAAQARVCHLEALTQGGLQVQARARRLRQLLQSDGRQFYSEAVEAWLASNTLFVLEASADRIDGEEFRRGLRLTHELPTEDRPSLKAGWQASRCQFLLAARPPTKVEAFLRRRLDHWSIGLAPGRRVPRFSAYIALLGQSAPPCVMAAALRTACNGWLTTARFQQRSHCAFGCGGGFDCIRHYAHCGLYHRWCEEACALEPPPAQARLASFLGLHAPMGLEATPVPRTSDEMRLLRAVCIYALYRAHLAVRHKAVFQFDAGHLFKAAVREACAREPLNGLLARRRQFEVSGLQFSALAAARVPDGGAAAGDPAARASEGAGAAPGRGAGRGRGGRGGGARGEDSDADGDAQESSSDSDEGLDRLARLEVDLAVDHQLRRARLEDKCRTKMQRVQRKKKETRRERVMAAWAGEMGAFNEAIDRQAAEDHALKDKDSDDDEADDDSEDDLKALRDFQTSQKSAQKALGAGAGGMDPVALEALAAGPSGSGGPGRANATEGGAESDEDEAVAAPRMKKSKTGEAIVPAERTEEQLRAEARAERWFGQDIFQGLTPSSGSRALAPAGSEASDDGSEPEDFAVVASQMRELKDNQLPNMPLTDKQKRQLKRKKDNERKGKGNVEEDNRPMEIAPLEAPKPLVPAKNQKPSDPQELAETLALGSLMVDSKKSRMALMDQFRAKLREINARPIRKVTEAKNRKKRRLQKRLEKLRSTAMSLADVGDMSEVAKARQMRKAISKAARDDQRKVQVVAIKKGGGGRQTTKGKAPKGAKVKVVDKRMKSDRRGEKKAAAFNKKRQRTLNKKAQNKRKGKASAGGGSRDSGGKGVFNRGSA
ncbi:unnamed protein product [Prorocentrum cordatum]|uniref:Ribosomal RNA methyltransferase SPB1-like C-terminal domain-containing protein n=1 Tax=Prorocentrum cordatum TaxID=2364126 RepID=A0ABN9UKN0_9DINO|nr:unnamed protein product [Polarella glacialis]